MKASELIDLLRAHIEENGDTEVSARDSWGERDVPTIGLSHVLISRNHQESIYTIEAERNYD